VDQGQDLAERERDAEVEERAGEDRLLGGDQRLVLATHGQEDQPKMRFVARPPEVRLDVSLDW